MPGLSASAAPQAHRVGLPHGNMGHDGKAEVVIPCLLGGLNPGVVCLGRHPARGLRGAGRWGKRAGQVLNAKREEWFMSPSFKYAKLIIAKAMLSKKRLGMQ